MSSGNSEANMKDRNFLVTTEADKEVIMEYPEVLKMVEFTPLLDRVEKEQPELLGGLIKVFEKMKAEDFQQYINSLLSIKKHQKEMLLITRNPRHKSIIERDYLRVLQEAFEVDKIRIYCQG